MLTMNSVGIANSLAGILEVNNGVIGTQRDLKLRNLFAVPSTAAGTDPAIWVDSSVSASYVKIFDNGTMIIDGDVATATYPFTVKYNGTIIAQLDYQGTLVVTNVIATGSVQSDKAIVNGGVVDTIASAATIAPTKQATYVSGTAAINTITTPFGGNNGYLTIIPTGIFTWTTAGNIAIAGTAVVNRALIFTYDVTAVKWYPSYI